MIEKPLMDWRKVTDIDFPKIKELILDSSISAYKIEEVTGANRSVIAKIRRGKVPFESSSIRTLMKWQAFLDYQENGKMK